MGCPNEDIDKICEELHTILKEAARKLMKILIGGDSTPTRMFDIMVKYLLTCLFFFMFLLSVAVGPYSWSFLSALDFESTLPLWTPRVNSRFHRGGSFDITLPLWTACVVPSAFKF
jgi:hypothetical protein